MQPRIALLFVLASAFAVSLPVRAQDAPGAPAAAASAETTAVSPLLVAVAAGDTAAVTALLDKGADINATGLLAANGDDEPMTPLMVAAYLGNLEMAKLLLERGANPNVANLAGGTALMAAIYNRRTTLAMVAETRAQIEKALAEAQAALADVNFQMPVAAPKRRGLFNLGGLLDIGGKIFMAAATGGTSALFQGLIKDQVTRYVAGKVGGPLGGVLQAAAGGDLKAAFPAVVGSAAQGNPMLLQGLLGGGRPMGAEQWIGLAQAAGRGGGPDALASLTAIGKSTEGLSPQWAAFVKAAAAGRPDAKGMFELARKEVGGSLEAFEKGLRALGDEGDADPQAERALAALLLERGARIDARAEAGMTPLAMAAYAGRADIVGLLLDKGAAVDVVDEEGRTPLMAAAGTGKTEVVKLLLDRGADPRRKDNLGDTAFDHADLMEHEPVKALLKSR